MRRWQALPRLVEFISTPGPTLCAKWRMTPALLPLPNLLMARMAAARVDLDLGLLHHQLPTKSCRNPETALGAVFLVLLDRKMKNASWRIHFLQLLNFRTLPTNHPTALLDSLH